MSDVIEVFKDIPWYEWKYQVSNFWNVNNIEWIILKNIKHNMWYYTVCIMGKKLLVHRLVASAFLWLDLNNRKQWVLHKNDIKTDNTIQNLYLWTQSENLKDSYKNWRKSTIQNYVRRWAKNKNSKLTDDNIVTIFEMRKEGKTQSYIWNFFGTTQDNICRILKWQKWKHLTTNLI